MFCLHYIADLPPVQHVEPNSSVTVPCPVFSASEMVFKLYKGLEAIFSISINQTFRSQINKNPKIDFSANFKFNDTDNSTSFILEAVTMNTTGLYTCEAEKIFPPPFQIVVHKPQTIVLVEGMFTMVVTQQQTLSLSTALWTELKQIEIWLANCL